MDWLRTTLRKGTKSPKICRDMFITDTRGSFKLCQVKNGNLVKKQDLMKETAEKIIRDNRLVKSGAIFNGCFTYRDIESTKLVNGLLAT